MENSNSITATILDNITPEDIHEFPFTWASWPEVMGAQDYTKLMDAYPTVSQVVGHREYIDNARYDIDAAELLKRTDIDPVMKDFIKLHTSQEFWLKIVHIFGDQIRTRHPLLEARVGKPLEEFVVGVRNGKHVEEIDIEMDAKPGYNTPVAEAGSVRGPHLDNPHELFAALMYCRFDGDTSTGGNFVIDKTNVNSKYWKWHGKMELYPNVFEDHATVEYSKNRACAFINFDNAVHHVTPRDITFFPRRLMNFIAEVRKPLFAIPKKRYPSP